MPEFPPKKAQAIIALTGGKGERIETAKYWLDRGVVQKMLITGLHPETTAEHVFDIAGGKRETYDCCVTLGRQARTTTGNGLEAAQWLATNKFNEAIIVTSDYHTARAYVELKSASPHVNFQIHSVRSPNVDLHANIVSPSVHARIAKEYLKFIFAWTRWRFNQIARSLS